MINFLLRFWIPGRRSAARPGAGAFTLQKMAAGGMRDHLGGGFHRYSVDEFWHVPHFENALRPSPTVDLLHGSVAVDARRIFRGDRPRDAGLCPAGHDASKGGFFSAEDADSLLSRDRPEHAEGAFYVWEKREIVRALGAGEADIFCRHYGVEERGEMPVTRISVARSGDVVPGGEETACWRGSPASITADATRNAAEAETHADHRLFIKPSTGISLGAGDSAAQAVFGGIFVIGFSVLSPWPR